jgi:hypothetical protein
VKRYGNYGRKVSWKIWKKGKLNSEQIWKMRKKSKLNSEKISKLWKKSKLNCEMVWKIWRKSKLNSEQIWKMRKMYYYYSKEKAKEMTSLPVTWLPMASFTVMQLLVIFWKPIIRWFFWGEPLYWNVFYVILSLLLLSVSRKQDTHM